MLALLCLATLLRVGVINRQGLWADEVFSLAIATGHSLEHPAAQADPLLGDFIEPPLPLPPSAYNRYLQHKQPVAGPGASSRFALRCQCAALLSIALCVDSAPGHQRRSSASVLCP